MSNFSYDRIVLEGERVETSLVDLATEISTIQESLQAEFDVWIERTRKSLVPPEWPNVPQFDPSLPVRYDTPERMQLPLAHAVWARGLMAAWRKTEDERVAKKFLRPVGGDLVRDFPPEWMSKWASQNVN